MISAKILGLLFPHKSALLALFYADPDEPPLMLRNGLHGPVLFSDPIETGRGGPVDAKFVGIA